MTGPYKTPEDLEKQIAVLKQQLNSAIEGTVDHIECNPETIEHGLAKLVLGLIDLLRRLLERQAIRRMEGGSLSDEQVESMGLSLMKLEEKIRELAAGFGLKPEDLDLTLGPLVNKLDE